MSGRARARATATGGAAVVLLGLGLPGPAVRAAAPRADAGALVHWARSFAAGLFPHEEVFPIAGPHRLGTGEDRFGAPRGGHRHEGQDVFAACGTPVVAARGGRVRRRATESAAGNYLVVAEEDTAVDAVYMHLRSPARAGEGARVRTGERLGAVGDTGDASACHLHFELWSAPGWYAGGRPFDPRPALEAAEGR